MKKGDLVIDLRDRDVRYRLHAQKERVTPEKMDRIHKRIGTLMYWASLIAKDDWPIPEPPADAEPTDA